MLWRLSCSDLWCTLAHWQQSPLWAVIALRGNFISKQYYILWSNWISLTAIVTVDVMLHQRQLHIKIWVWQAVTTEVQLIKKVNFYDSFANCHWMHTVTVWWSQKKLYRSQKETHSQIGPTKLTLSVGCIEKFWRQNISCFGTSYSHKMVEEELP